MTEQEMPRVAPREAYRMMNEGAALLDVREFPEWNESHVPGGALIPLGEVKKLPQRAALAPQVLVLCRTGKRSEVAARLIQECGVANALVIDGGLEEWRATGLPSQKAGGGPISLERQVRIGAGSLLLLGMFVPRLRIFSWLVPCGLLFAGLTDWCGMAKLLGKAPWNRPRGDERERSLELAARHRASIHNQNKSGEAL